MLGFYYSPKAPYRPLLTKWVNQLFLGVPGTGKSEALIRLFLDQIYKGKSGVFIDPKGHAIDVILDYIPPERQKDVILFKPSLFPFAFNPLAGVRTSERALVTSLIVEMFKGVWPSAVETTRIDRYATIGVASILEAGYGSLKNLRTLLLDDEYRKQMLVHVSDSIVLEEWEIFEKDKKRDEKTESILSRLLAIFIDPVIRDVLDKKTNKLVFKDKIVLVSLNEGELGLRGTKLLGSLVLTSLIAAGVGGLRSMVYIDHAHAFPSALLRDLLVRCPHLTTTIAVQFLSQLHEDERDTILSSMRLVAFRTSLEDSERLAPKLLLTQENTDPQLEDLPDHQAYTLIHGKRQQMLMPRHNYLPTHQAQKIIRRCKSQLV